MPNPYISLLKTAWKYSREKKKRYVVIYAMFILANITLAMNPILYGWFVDGLQKEGVSALHYAWIYAGGFLALRFIEWCFHGPARIMERELAFHIGRNFLEEHYHKVLHLPVQWHQEHHSGSTISRVRKGYESLKDFFQNGFVSLHALGKFIFSFVAVLYFSPLFGTIAIALGIFTVWVIYKFDKPYIQSIREINEKEHEVSSTIFDSLSNIITVITLRLEKRIKESLLTKVFNVFPFFRKNILINEWKWFTAQMLIGLIYAVVVLGFVYQNYKPGHVFLIGGLVTLLGYINQFTSVFNDVASQYSKIQQYHTDVQAASHLVKSYKENKNEETAKFPADWKTIEIKKLGFAHAEGAGGLKDIHLKLQKGKKIALIGESGCGKSTLLALLRGLYTPLPGVEVKIDAMHSSDYSNINNVVTLFPQEPEIFENTILYNITLGLPFSKDEIIKVCETAQFKDVINGLPNGLDTHIQEKGVNLSGGQKQRLALARGILAAKSSDIVLLDEPTSSVDPRTEKHIYLNLFSIFSDKAIVSSLHRLHLLPLFDYIYIIKNGEIADEGTFSDLLRNSELFKEMWKPQNEIYNNAAV